MEDHITKRHRTKTIVKFLVLSVILIFNITLWSDTRSESIDLIIALNISCSMKENLEAAKEYIINILITDKLIIGDYLLVIGFDRDTEVITAGTINSDEDKENLKKDVSRVETGECWTDTGTMFDRLGEELETGLNNNRRKRFLILTDNINNPPPDSPYYTEDGKLHHEYLEKIDVLFEYPGWQVQILSIQTDPIRWEMILDSDEELMELLELTEERD